MRRLLVTIGIFALAVGVRWTLLSGRPERDFLYGQQTAHGFHAGDEGINIAVALAAKGEFADPFVSETGLSAHVPPAFPVVTSLVFRWFGFGHRAAAVRNGILIGGMGALLASLPGASAALGIGFFEGAIAGFLAAIYPMFRANEVFRGRDEWLAALLLLWLTVLAYGICKRREFTWRDAWLLAIGWGILLQTQPSALLVLFVQVAFCAMRLRTAAGRNAALGRASVGAALLAVLLTPWTLRNRRELGAWMFMRDNLGLELRVGNGDDAKPSLAENMASDEFSRIHPMFSAAAAEKIREVGEVELNREMEREAKTWIVHHPAQFARLTIERFIDFWADAPAPRDTRVVRLSWSLLAWAGVILLWRSGSRMAALLIGSILIVYPLTYYVLQYSSRYVVPICFAILLPAGFALREAGGAALGWVLLRRQQQRNKILSAAVGR